MVCNVTLEGFDQQRRRVPGYLFAHQVPPKSECLSKNLISVMPYHRFSVAPRPMAEKPEPMQANWL
jgi:hypothetical protein